MGFLDLPLRFRLDVGIDRKRDLVCLLDRCWLGLLLGKTVALLQSYRLQPTHLLDNLVQLGLKPLVRSQLGRALDQRVKGTVKILFGGFQMPGLIILPAQLVVLFCFGNEVGYRIHFCRAAIGFCGGSGSRRGGQSWNRLRRRFRRDKPLCIAPAGNQQARTTNQAQQFGNPSNPHRPLRLPTPVVSSRCRIVLCHSLKGQCAKVLTKVTSSTSCRKTYLMPLDDPAVASIICHPEGSARDCEGSAPRRP